MMNATSLVGSPRRRHRFVAAFGVLLAAALVLTTYSMRSSVVDALISAASASAYRRIEPRLTLIPANRPLQPNRRGVGLRTEWNRRLLRAASAVLKELPAAGANTRARATAYLLAGDTQAAIAELRAGRRFDSRLLSDLSASLLVASDSTSRVELATDALAAAD